MENRYLSKHKIGKSDTFHGSNINEPITERNKCNLLTKPPLLTTLNLNKIQYSCNDSTGMGRGISLSDNCPVDLFGRTVGIGQAGLLCV